MEKSHNKESICQQIFCKSDFLVFSVDEQMKITSINSAAEKFYGVHQKNIINKDVGILDPEIKIFLKKNQEKSNKKSQSITIHFREKCINWSILSTSMDKKNRYLIGKDISEFVYAKGKETSYFEKIIEHVPHYIFWKDRAGCFLGCNENFAKAANLIDRNKIIGKTDYDLPWTKSQSDAYRKDDEAVMLSGIPRLNIEEPQLRKNGEEVILLTSKVPMFDNHGKINGLLGVFADISEFKKLEKALEAQIKKTEAAYYSKTEFLSTVTHEIRNPVGNVVSYDYFLKEDLQKLKEFFYKEIVDDLDLNKKDKFIIKYNELFNKVMKSVNTIEGEAFKALEYLKGVGELHRLQSEGVKVSFTSIDVKQLIQRITEDTVHYNTKNVEIMASIDPALPETVVIDYFNIFDALLVILSNALRFSHEGGVVKLDLNADKKEKGLVIKVQNFGESISEEQVDALLGDRKNKKLDPRGAIYRKPSLRLTQAKLQIESSGGTLDIERTEKSTQVIIFVPYGKEPHKGFVKSHVKDVKSSDKDSFTQRHILVIEDDVTFRETECKMIEELGHLSTLVSTGKQALILLSENTYDIIFLDITLPDISGVEILKNIRKTKKTKSLPVVVLTSHAHKKDIHFFEQLGATLVLTKPLSRNDFKDCLEFDFDADDDDE